MYNTLGGLNLEEKIDFLQKYQKKKKKKKKKETHHFKMNRVFADFKTEVTASKMFTQLKNGSKTDKLIFICKGIRRCFQIFK